MRATQLVDEDVLPLYLMCRASAARSASSRAIAEVKVDGRVRGDRDGGRCGLDGWARLSATWAMPWPLE